jgi:hypothetical protein
VLRFGSIIGATTVSALAIAPAFAAAATSQSSAQSLQLSIAGHSAVSQTITASNNGTTETRNDASTVPTLADLVTGNNAIGVGVAPQDAHANTDGTSFACAGLAGPGGGIAYVGKKSCNIDGDVLSLNLGTLNLDLVHLLGNEGAITGPLNDALSPILQNLDLLGQLDGVVAKLTTALEGTPLGDISITGGLSAVEAACTADPDKATGTSKIVDSNGDQTIPIAVTIPTSGGGTQTLDVVNLDVDVAPKPGGTDVLVNLDTITQALINAVSQELSTALGGALADLNNQVIKVALQAVQDSLIKPITDALRDTLLQQLSDNVLKLVVNDRTYGDGGKSVDVTTLSVDVLPAAKAFTGSALVSGDIGHVTCGPNTRASAPEQPGTPNSPENPKSPHVPNVVDSGVAGHADHTARNVLGATAALMLLAGTAGLMGYRRMINK